MISGKYFCSRCGGEATVGLTFFQASKVALGFKVPAPDYCKGCLDTREAFKNYVKTK